MLGHHQHASKTPFKWRFAGGPMMARLKLTDIHVLALFPPFTANVVCSLICICTLVGYIANNMDPDQTAPWSSLIRVQSVYFYGKSFLQGI